MKKFFRIGILCCLCQVNAPEKDCPTQAECNQAAVDFMRQDIPDPKITAQFHKCLREGTITFPGLRNPHF